MIIAQFVATFFLVAGGLWATFRPLSAVERRADKQRPATSGSIVVYRSGILVVTALLLWWVWAA
jgi:hypothetical protein